MKRFLLALLVPFALSATELKPWFGNAFEIEARGTYVFQNFQEVETGLGLQSYVSNDNFGTLSLATNIFGNWNAEFEVTGAQTRAHGFTFDNARLTGRYLVMDDVVGDPVSLVVGLTMTEASHVAVVDIGSFHHALFEGELHVAMGKEYLCGTRWKSRWWLVGGVGMGIRGAPWLRGDAVFQIQHLIGHALEFGGYSLWGTGNRNIGLVEKFNGYGCIDHCSFDLGVAYLYRFDIWGTLKIGYRKRLYAHNFPYKANYLIIEYLYPFGL